MSLEAYVWVANLRIDECSGTAFRVLLKYADRADKYGRTAWYKASDLALDLGCHRSTVQRAIAELLDLGLMSKGDQRYVQHIPGQYRPVVYDLETPAKRMQDARPDVAYENTCDEAGVAELRDTDGASDATHRTVNEPSYQDSFSHPALVSARESGG